MIPTLISVRNFMCYRTGIDIDLRGVRVACLSGENGAGKSALLDSITWALWGKARVNSDRELIALNTTEMEVTFGFELHDQEFRVTRRRSRGGAGQLSLDLQTLDGARWRTISGATARETQRAIDRLLKLDYDTFINSAFILQGRADEFTTKTPALRKQTLAEILNLSDYDRYEEVARQQFREHERRLREIDAAIDRLDLRLAELPARQREVERLGSELLRLGDQVQQASERCSAAHERLRLLELAADQRNILRNEIKTLDDEIAKLDTSRQTIVARVARNRAVLARKDEIAAQHRELQALRRENEQIGDLLTRRQGLLNRRRTVEIVIQKAQHEVEGQALSVRDRIKHLTTTAAARSGLELEHARLRSEIDALTEISARLEQMRTLQSRQEARSGELAAKNRQLMADMQELKGKMGQLEDASATCPVCRRELGPAERTRLRNEYQAEGTAQGDRFRENKRQIVQIEASLETSKRDILNLERQRKQSEALAREEATLVERLAACGRAESELVEHRTQEAVLAARLASGEIAAIERAELSALDEQLTAIPFDETRYRMVHDRMQSLAPVEAEVSKLLVAGTALASDLEQIELIETTRTERITSREQKALQEASLSQNIEALARVREEYDLLAAELNQFERQRSEAQEQFGAARQRVEDLLSQVEEREAKTRERQCTAQQKAIYDELMLAFGKRGIQAMIIENVVPELEDTANRILDKMPGNTMRVEFRTQRQTARGEGTIETLDIIIGDEVGHRAYELYSGGEAFRLNFAIRVALSMLLARRAGARLQTLVIDEGFGTQDTRGRDGLIEAIRAIEPDFHMILVITHIAELKEMFPTRIDVVKEIDGSRVFVN
jgi:DNA repair protein SbcC/Rad50